MSTPPRSETVPAVNTCIADYPGLFGDEGVERCPVDALESSFGPFAYAESLATIVRRLETKVGNPPASPLAGRRPDIAKLLMDEPSLNRRVPRLNLAVECLEAMVEATHSGNDKAAAVLTAATSPAALPFDRAWALVTQVLRSKRQHAWTLLRQTDEDYPNFSDRTIVNSAMRGALPLCTGLSPAQLRALKAAPAPNDSALWLRLGVPANSTIAKLADSATFLKATGLNRKRLRQLLAVNGVAKDGAPGTYSAVTVSEKGMPDAAARAGADSRVFGACFVNGGKFVDGQKPPALRLVAGGANGRTTCIENLGARHLHRIDAMLRLHSGTGLPFATLDRLLQAIFGAQGLGEGTRNDDLGIDNNTLRALGLFCHLRDSRQVDPHAFAAVLHEISPYATGRDTPYYDTLFLSGAGENALDSTTPLAMDGSAFVNAVGDATMQQLCAGLRVSLPTLSALMGWITKARKLAAPTRELSLVSACHRLAVLPRWLGHDEKQGLALLRLFGDTQPDLFGLLTGVPKLSRSSAGNQPDLVDAIVTLMNFSDWLRRHRLDAVSLSRLLDGTTPPNSQLTRPIPKLSITTHTVTDDRLREAFSKMPFAKDVASRPVEVLSSLVESTGLFKDSVFDMDSDTFDMEVALAIEPLGDKTPGTLVANAVRLEQTKARVTERLRECLNGQASLLDKTLTALLPGIADPALRTSLARWVGATPTAVLQLLNSRASPNENVLAWLRALHHRARWVSLLAIDSPTIDAMRSHRQWFDLEEADVINPGLIFAHRVTEWNATVRDVAARTGVEEAKAGKDIVAYLARFDDNAATPQLATLLQVDKSVVTSIASRVARTTPRNSLTTARQLAWLIRLQALADRTSTSVEALLALAHLGPESPADDVEAAGQLFLATCEPAERDDIVRAHDDAWRHAMVAWLMHHAVDSNGKRFAHRDDLSAFLLTDVDVGPEPETTRLAAAIDSLQIYIHRLLTGLEEHLNQKMNIKKERLEWSAYRSRYVDWRRYKERRAYPENHIHPANRKRKTEAFLDLETQLAQGQARPADIDTTLLRYLNDFERTSNLQIISGYHDGIDPAEDELHLIGRTNIEPYEYFWQSATMEVKAADNRPGMLAWSGWKKITLPVNGELAQTAIPPSTDANVDTYDVDVRKTIEAIRPLTIGGRKYIVWIERDTSAIVFDTESADSGYYALRVCYSYLDTNGNWSASNTLLSLDGRMADGTRPRPPSIPQGADQKTRLSAPDVPTRMLFRRSFKPGLIVMENRKGRRKTEPYLVAMLFDSNLLLPSGTDVKAWKRNEDYFLAVRDLLLIDEKLLDDPSTIDSLKKQTPDDSAGSTAISLETQLVDNWLKLFRDPRVVQHPYIGAKYELQPPPEDQVTRLTDATLDALRRTLDMDDVVDVGISAVLSRDGNEIEVTGGFDSVWSRRRSITSIDDIERVDVDVVIEIKDTVSYDPSNRRTGQTTVVADFRIRASIATEAWSIEQLAIESIDIRISEKDILSRYIYENKSVLKDAGVDFKTLGNDADSQAIAAIQFMLPQLDVKSKTLKIDKTLASLLDAPSLLPPNPQDSGGRIGSKILVMQSLGQSYLFVPQTELRTTLLPRALDSGSQEDSTIPLQAELIRVRNTQGSAAVADDPELKSDLALRDPSVQKDAGPSENIPTIYALATSATPGDRAALAAWLPVLTETWKIPASGYYEALRKVGLPYGNPDESTLSGSLPFLQAMHATGRQELRDAFIVLMTATLGEGLPDETRAKLPAELRAELVRFAAQEQDNYRALFARLDKFIGGSDADIVLGTAMLDAHDSGTKRIVARIDTNLDETDYTFRVVFKTTDDPGNPADQTYKERVRLTAPYKLTRFIKVLEAGSKTADDRVPTARIHRNSAQAQYLDLDESGLLPIRLNTLFGKQLVARATRSVDAAISIGAQILPEPALRAGGSGGFVDFRGANGLYFWELFFHAPWLVAWSLREKSHYTEALRWCTRYLFDPLRGQTNDSTAPVPFWNCLPLVYPLDGAKDTGETPELAGYENAIYFRKALHAFLVELWRMEGDEQFRRLTPDSVREASLLYHKALRLIGTLQEPAETKPWTPTLLGSREAVFAQPVNTTLLDIRALLLARLDNLNHGRTIDGVLLPYLGYGDEDLDGGTSGGRRGGTGGSRALSIQTIPAFRFHEVVTVALAAVERLTDLGRYLFRIVEHEADNALEVERQRHLLDLADFDISLREKALATVTRERDTLRLSLGAAYGRVKYYQGQLAYPRSALEIAGALLGNASVGTLYARYVPTLVKAGLAMLPTIFGISFGNGKPKASPEAVDHALEVTAEATRLLSEELRQESAYERRNEEWAFDEAQAEHDVRIIGSQIDEQEIRIASATIELKEATQRRECLRDEFEVQTTGFAVASTYTWMLGRLGELFASAYQSVLTLCLDAQASFRYETGDFDSRHIRLDAWNGAQRGMFAGEALQNDLHGMQAAFLRRHVRRLNIHKTVSLKALLGKDDKNRDNLVAALNSSKLSFDLGEKLFDADFPGHYLRQIQHLAVALIPKAGATTLGPDTEIRAVLTQTSNTLLYRADPHGAEWLYDPTRATASANAILRDLRGDQQVILSHASPRQTADPMETIVLRADYTDGRYGTFEGTGAVSSWTLSFPGKESDSKALRDQIEDIEIRLDYFAAWGGTEFKEAVDGLFDAASTATATPADTGDTSVPVETPADATAYSQPVVREVRARNALDRRDAPDGATVTVAPWPAIREGQQVWLWCFGKTYGGTSINRALRGPSNPISKDEEAQGIEATIVPEYLEALGDYAQLRIVCKVSLDGSGASSTARTFPELTIDLPKCVALSLTTAKTDKDWVAHTSPPTPLIHAHAGYLALSEKEGPMALASMPRSPTTLEATVVAEIADPGNPVAQQYPLVLKARRSWGGGGSYGMHDYRRPAGAPAYSGSTFFRIQCLAADNADLPPGRYKGQLILQLVGKEIPRVLESIFIDIAVSVEPPPPDPEEEATPPPVDPDPVTPPVEEEGEEEEPTPTPTAFLAPVVDKVRANNALDRRDVADGATITVAPWPGIRKGQRIWMTCKGTKADDTAYDRALVPTSPTVTRAEINGGVSVPLPLDYLTDLGDYAQLQIVFKASLDGGDDETTAHAFPLLTLDLPRCVTATVGQILSDGQSHQSVDVWSPLPPTSWAPSSAGYVTLSAEVGPTTLALDPPYPTKLNIDVVSQADHTKQTLNITAMQTGEHGINYYGETTTTRAINKRVLLIKCLATNNPDLPAGTYKGQATFHLMGYEPRRVYDSALVTFDITV